MLFSHDEKPRLQDQKLWKALPRDPVELLLLAHIDGKTTVQDLSVICAKSLDETLQILEKMVHMGILEPPEGNLTQSKEPTPTHLVPEVKSANEFLVDPRFLKQLHEIDTRVLAENVDLEPQRKEEILLLYHSLSTLTPFQLFGVRTNTTDKEVKRAYQRLSMRFHPDRYYGKNLGSFKPMIESIFHVISQTFAMLSSAENRKKLAAVYPDEIEEKETQRSLSSPQTAPITTSFVSPSAAKQRRTDTSGTDAPVTLPRHSVRHRVGLRNQIASVLARTESKSMVSGDSSSEETESESIVLPPSGGYKTPPVRFPGNDVLHRMASEKLQRIQTHFAEGKRALTTQNYGTAASHFKLVLSLDPQHEEAARLYKEAETKNRDFLGNSYAARARMEDEMGAYEKAAELWDFALEYQPTLENFMAAATVFIKIRNYVKARQYAQQAVALSDKPEPAILLAQVYLAAGMALRAQSTLKKLLEKYPRHPVATRLLREAEKSTK